MSAPTNRRRIATWLAVTTLTVGMSVGCTAGDWRYDAPPAAGTQADADTTKARNFMVIADDSGQAMLLGSVASVEPVSIAGMVVAAEAEDNQFGEPVEIAFQADIPRDGLVKLEGEATKFEDTELQLGRLAQVTVSLGDGQALQLKVPVYSSEHPDYSETWSSVYG